MGKLNKPKPYYNAVRFLQFVSWFIIWNMYRIKDKIIPSKTISLLMMLYTVFHICTVLYATRKEVPKYRSIIIVSFAIIAIFIGLQLSNKIFVSKMDFSFPFLRIHLFLFFLLILISLIFSRYVEEGLD